MSTLTLPDSRAATADRVIAAMAGSDARLREDQATAVAACASRAPGCWSCRRPAGASRRSTGPPPRSAGREGAGPTLVVSPLLSLMRDQVAAAGARRAPRSDAELVEHRRVVGDREAALLAGDVDVLLVSPERLANPGFGRRVLDGLAGRLGLVVIDEAHAVSDWGHDFRPDYRRVSDVLQRLNPETPVLATTATANARVTDDVARQLGEATLVLRGQLARASLQLSVVDRLSPLERYAWVVDHLPRLPGSGIVYTLTVADAQRLAAAVREVHGAAVPVAAYTGQLDPAERERLEDALRDNELKALVATSALGMGYDKPDLGFVVHVGSPPSPVSYYQQVGRAGPRDRPRPRGAAALRRGRRRVGLLRHRDDPAARTGASGCSPCSSGEEPLSVAAVEAQSGVRRGRVELMLKQLAVDGVVERVEGGWLATGAAGPTTPRTTTAWSPYAAARPTSCAPTPAASAA